ncbi:hypothetical protein F0562_029138 [Nyssa sinensis]|uniref:Uncharacterized protein n=1 Tax=Nyssa sinensis TaxID=561372 RepID=A0A5J5B278_9ASTE|nr:hypothetical protein F0562_029138 [Nyssa sinensis]
MSELRMMVGSEGHAQEQCNGRWVDVEQTETRTSSGGRNGEERIARLTRDHDDGEGARVAEELHDRDGESLRRLTTVDKDTAMQHGRYPLAPELKEDLMRAKLLNQLGSREAAFCPMGWLIDCQLETKRSFKEEMDKVYVQIVAGVIKPPEPVVDSGLGMLLMEVTEAEVTEWVTRKIKELRDFSGSDI